MEEDKRSQRSFTKMSRDSTHTHTTRIRYPSELYIRALVREFTGIGSSALSEYTYCAYRSIIELNKKKAEKYLVIM